MRLWGKCDCCEALRSEVDFLRSLIRPKPALKERLPVITLEADALLSGADEQVDSDKSFDEQELRRREDVDSERARLLAGTY